MTYLVWSRLDRASLGCFPSYPAALAAIKDWASIRGRSTADYEIEKEVAGWPKPPGLEPPSDPDCGYSGEKNFHAPFENAQAMAPRELATLYRDDDPPCPCCGDRWTDCCCEGWPNEAEEDARMTEDEAASDERWAQAAAERLAEERWAQDCGEATLTEGERNR